MKKQNTPSIHAHRLRGALYLLLLLPVCVSPFALAQRNATKLRRGQVRQREQGIALPANIIVVTNTNDSGPGSLRNALSIANGGDTIDATGVSGTILLTSGELWINHNVTIKGPGAETLAVNGNGSSRVCTTVAPDVTITGLTITNGTEGILNIGNVTVNNCVISGNFGSGIRNTAPHNIGGGGGADCDQLHYQRKLVRLRRRHFQYCGCHNQQQYYQRQLGQPWRRHFQRGWSRDDKQQHS
jgi:hypothetical protein